MTNTPFYFIAIALFFIASAQFEKVNDKHGEYICLLIALILLGIMITYIFVSK